MRVTLGLTIILFPVFAVKIKEQLTSKAVSDRFDFGD